MSDLNIVFIDELTVADPASVVSFGRSADVVVDEANQYMHRVVGTFFHQDNVWWITNKSRHGVLTLVGDTGKVARLPPEAVSALTEAHGLVRFESGPSTYEIGWSRPDASPMLAPTIDPGVDEIDATTQFGVVALNDEQRLMLVALAERQLLDSSVPATDLPSNASIAHRLGWSLKKLDRKLDYLCARLDGEGVRGLRGGKGIEAVDRRTRLVEHVIGSGLVTATDIDLLQT
ncbi:MAG: hypothetical protein ACR2P0_11980 [Acidimicrobiales bacterium]